MENTTTKLPDCDSCEIAYDPESCHDCGCHCSQENCPGCWGKECIKLAEPTCPACPTGYLVCIHCNYRKETKPKPKDLSNRYALDACTCQACDGGVMECDACGYTYDSIQGFHDYYKF